VENRCCPKEINYDISYPSVENIIFTASRRKNWKFYNPKAEIG
jgi:hypothetical protein